LLVGGGSGLALYCAVAWFAGLIEEPERQVVVKMLNRFKKSLPIGRISDHNDA
jgi:hypothetical protein